MEKAFIQVGGKKIEFEKKGWTLKANGEAIVRCGGTEVLAAAVMSSRPSEERGFFPLTVNFEEKFYAGGKILGSRYVRREGRPSDNATLISRLIDRTIRPVFSSEFQQETQVIIICLSWDEENDPDILAILAASLALSTSDIPWDGPVAAVRVGLQDNKLIVNPTYEQRENSPLDILLSGKKANDQILINMIEAEAKEVDEETILKATQLALPEIEKLIGFQEEIIAKIGREKAVFGPRIDKETIAAVKKFLGNKIEKILFAQKQAGCQQGIEKGRQIDKLEIELVESLKEDYPDKETIVRDAFNKEVTRIVQENILKKEQRVDGRKLDEVRELHSEIDLLPRAHGSGYFSRGVTRSLSALTLGGPGERQLIEGMEIQGKKRFLHHYNFLPYSVGEVKPLRSPGRREIGHGILAEKALRPILPEFDDFPYTIRIVTEILSSNGSTSMASVCSSSLALMAAGVPIKRPVAGIAIGLVKQDKDYKVITDIQGPEDFHGKMDFKVAGTREGITAIQMDVKTKGIDKEIMKEALARAQKARLEILELIEQTISQPRKELSPLAPKIFRMQIDPEKIGEVIGSKGETIKRISAETETTINIEDSGEIYITAQEEEGAKKAMEIISQITKEIEVGEWFMGTVKKTLEFGNIIELTPKQKGLLHRSRCSQKLKIGDKIKVKVINIDHLGRIDLGTEQASQPHSKRPPLRRPALKRPSKTYGQKRTRNPRRN